MIRFVLKPATKHYGIVLGGLGRAHPDGSSEAVAKARCLSYENWKRQRQLILGRVQMIRFVVRPVGDLLLLEEPGEAAVARHPRTRRRPSRHHRNSESALGPISSSWYG